MGDRETGDRGQAFPLYIVAVTGLLFAAFVFFVVGQASVTRSDAQGAADAAALAAAREAGEKGLAALDLAALKPKDWADLLTGAFLDGAGACAAADDFAAKNDAVATCQPSLPRFDVAVTTNRTVGKSVIPGTDGMHGEARASAVVESLCTLGSVTTTPSATALPGATATPGATASPAPSASAEPGRVKLLCKGGKSIEIDPLHPGSLRNLSRSLFKVRLVE
ncbi:pilus assembly protein TadG-related protein [Streptomyces sp. NPDC002033]|uniref:pilus assembly protein TadG-related protein n=1 Tax=unclassified Streptomyces TaxID=2593676 RepID=UPI003329C4AD